MRNRTRRRTRSVESLVVEATFTAVHDLTCRAIAGIVLVVQLALATAFVAVTVVRCLAAAAWESVHADDRLALRQGSAAAVRGCCWAACRLPGWMATVIVAAYRWCEGAGAWVGDRIHEAAVREYERSQRRRPGEYRLATPAEVHEIDRLVGYQREVPPPQEDAPEDPWADWQDEGAPVGAERMAA